MKAISITLALTLIGTWSGLSQGFVNLDFEHATIVPDPGSPFYPNAVYASNALPGWTITGSFLGPDEILYNHLSTGAQSISILDANSLRPILGGNYTLDLYGGGPSGVSISQTGVVPASAISLFFMGQPPFLGTLLVSLGGQNLPFVAVSNSLNYILYGATMPAGMAGQSEQLVFSALPGNNNYWELDNIQFSSSPIPEPSELALAAFGIFLLAFVRSRA